DRVGVEVVVGADDQGTTRKLPGPRLGIGLRAVPGLRVLVGGVLRFRVPGAHVPGRRVARALVLGRGILVFARRILVLRRAVLVLCGAVPVLRRTVLVPWRLVARGRILVAILRGVVCPHRAVAGGPAVVALLAGGGLGREQGGDAVPVGDGDGRGDGQHA